MYILPQFKKSNFLIGDIKTIYQSPHHEQPFIMVSFISFQIPFVKYKYIFFPLFFYTIGRLLYILFCACKSTFKVMCGFLAKPFPRIHYLSGNEKAHRP